MSHWYKQDGSPCYEVPYADPSKGMRKTSLKDARKMQLSPSVTTVLGIIANPQLEKWAKDQARMSALTLQRFKRETDEAFMKRLSIDDDFQRDTAAKHGTAIHHGAEAWLAGELKMELIQNVGIHIDRFNILEPLKSFVAFWVGGGYKVLHSEQSFSCVYGYGGKSDIVAENADGQVIIDIKTRDTKPDKPMVVYPKEGYQLAAYKRGLGLPPSTKLMNVVLSRNEPSRVAHVHVWDDEDDLWGVFESVLESWKRINKYRPDWSVPC